MKRRKNMYGYIDGYDFGEMEAMKYYAPPASWTDDKKRDNAHSKIFSGDWLGAEKKDGYFAKLIKDEDGNIILYSRSRGINGKFADKHEWVPHLNPFFDALPNGTCLLGELYLPSQPGSKNITTIMGCLKDKAVARQDKGEKLHFYVFDCLAWLGANQLHFPAKDRFWWISRMDTLDAFGEEELEYVSFAKYQTGKELWALLQDILGRGDEGIVITHKGGLYEPGKRPSKTTLKIKKELKQTIDCFFTGRGSAPTHEYTGKEIETWQMWEHQITHEKMLGSYYKEYKEGKPIIPVTKGYYNGWCGSLEIAVLRHKSGSRCIVNGKKYEDTEVMPLGWLSGLPDEMKANPEAYAFKPIEVTAMEYDAIAKTLRHGKMVGWRPDLTIEDCTLEKI
jgi:ATP-dependent DNA ligase